MKFLWVDTETTGVDEFKHEIIQLSGILEIPGKKGYEFDFRMRPNHPELADPIAMEINGISLNKAESFPDSASVYSEFKSILHGWVNPLVKEDKLILSGQNVSFDSRMIHQWFKSNNDKFWYANVTSGVFDLKTLSVMYEIYHDKFKFESYRLGSVCEGLGVKLTNAHDSLADIRATRECCLIIYNEIIKG